MFGIRKRAFNFEAEALRLDISSATFEFWTVGFHKENRYFLCLDLENFFGNIGYNSVYQVFAL